MFNFSKRSPKKELMDLGPDHYTDAEYRDCLRKLGSIGWLLGGDKALDHALARVSPNPKSILDVGCGGGQTAIRIAHHYPHAQIVGIDIDAQALVIAQENKTAYERKNNILLKNLSFQHYNQPELQEQKKSFDVVMMTLVLHHLSDDEIISFLIRAQSVARSAIIINDLHRSLWAYVAYSFISPLFFNRLIRYDGLLSIRRAFVKRDLENYVRQAHISQTRCKIMWKWAFRWIMVIDCHE